MNIELIISFLLFAGAIQGLFLGFFLVIHKKSNLKANRFLAIIIFILSLVIMFTIFFDYTPIFRILHDYLILLSSVFFLLYGPLFYIYSNSLLEKNFKITLKQYITFIPFIIMLIFVTFFYIYIRDTKAVYLLHNITSVLAVIYSIIFIVMTIKLLLNYYKFIKSSFSTIERMNLKWLIFLSISFYTILFIRFIADIIIDYLKLETEIWHYVSLLFSINMYAIGYFALFQSEVFTKQFDEDILLKNLKKKYETSALNEEKASSYYEKIKRTMEEEKPYLDNNITLPSLSKKLLIKPHHLSQIINDKFNKNFFDFINYHRIEEAKKMILAPENSNINISSIAFDSGFNSLSAFNTAFKKYTGITPSQFRNKINK